MSGFGGLNTLPLRLGGTDSTTSWTAEDHAAMARDLLCAARTVPFAHVEARRDLTTNAAALTRYRGINGIGPDFAPTLSIDSNTLRIVFPLSFTDERGLTRYVAIRHVEAAPANYRQINDVGDVTVTWAASGGSLRISVGTMAGGGSVRVTVWGCYIDETRLEDYGGATDKVNTETELVPYALSQLRALQDARGSAYSRERGTLVHVENLALARAHAATWRRAERLACNGNPATALEKAEEWRRCLGVRRRDGDTDATLRTRNAAKMRTALGPTRRVVDDAVVELLGPLFVRMWRNYGAETIADDDAGTFWPDVNPGAPSRNLGGGAWYSDRNHVVVEVQRPASVTQTEFDARMTDLTELLDVMLPATCTFAWVTGADDGFTLDEDLLDEGCLGG